MHLETKHYVTARQFSGRLLLATAALTLAGCGVTQRPVVSAINPVGPAGQPQKFAVAISSNPGQQGLVSIVDFSGDTILDTTLIGRDPQYLMLDSSGTMGYTLNGDGTLNSFNISTNLQANQVLQSTLLPGANPLALLVGGLNLYVAQSGRNSVAQLQAVGGGPPAIQQELRTGQGTVYTVGIANAPRAYAIVQGTAGTVGTVAGIEVATNTLSSSIPVGVNPVYGVMTADTRRAFILNKGSNTVSVVNAQSNALDNFSAAPVQAGTIPVGVAPVWADLAPTLSELVVANAGDGIHPGSVTIINIPLCSATTVTSNPTCDPANPVDAVGFGQVLATVPVGINPVMVAVMQDGSRAYVANAGNAATPGVPATPGSISVINLTTNTVTATIPAAASLNPADAVVHGHPGFISVTTGTPTGKAYVTAPDSLDLTIIRTDLDTVSTHLSLQGNGVQVRVTAP